MTKGRADKKRRVKLMTPLEVAAIVRDIGIHQRKPMGVVGATLALSTLRDVPTINRLSQFMWRDYHVGDLHWLGHTDRGDLGKVIRPDRTRMEGLYLRFDRDEWEYVAELAFALGSPVSHAVAALVTLGVRDLRIIHTFAPQFEYRSQYSLQRGTYLWR